MHRNRHKRVSKRLLVAALGVATVSYMGCAADGDVADEEFGAESLAEDSASATSAESAGQSVDKAARLNVDVSQATALELVAYPDKFPPAGNLMAPPPPPCGNLMPPPPPSGNLMAPPVLDHAAIEVSAASSLEAKKSICPPTGNLMPPPPAELELAR